MIACLNSCNWSLCNPAFLYPILYSSAEMVFLKLSFHSPKKGLTFLQDKINQISQEKQTISPEKQTWIFFSIVWCFHFIYLFLVTPLFMRDDLSSSTGAPSIGSCLVLTTGPPGKSRPFVLFNWKNCLAFIKIDPNATKQTHQLSDNNWAIIWLCDFCL